MKSEIDGAWQALTLQLNLVQTAQLVGLQGQLDGVAEQLSQVGFKAVPAGLPVNETSATGVPVVGTPVPAPPSDVEQHQLLDRAKSYDFGEVRALCEASPALLNSQPAGRWSVLMQAAHASDETMVEWLLRRGANPSAKAGDGKDAFATAREAAPGAQRDRCLARLAPWSGWVFQLGYVSLAPADRLELCQPGGAPGATVDTVS